MAGDVTPTGAPDLLPRAPRGFHGRAGEPAALSRAAEGEAPVCLVVGPAGVGKTALVLHWAHRCRAGYPDGLLHADLRGFGDTGEPAFVEVLREFLSARWGVMGPGAGRVFRPWWASRQRR